VKTVYRYLVKKFVGPFVLTFIFALIIFLMQFLWLYVDELVGKGLEIHLILELLFYASAGFVSSSAPLAILLSSLMTFGSMGEHYELVALKSAGISLSKLMIPLSIFSIFIGIISFVFSNHIAPRSFVQYKHLF
jgi:lipopolysaccharide export system permease protein